MEHLIMTVCMVAAVGTLAIIAMMAVIFWKSCFSPTAKKAEAVQEALTEAQERYLREQEEYAQGFDNQMHYDGRPRKRGEE